MDAIHVVLMVPALLVVAKELAIVDPLSTYYGVTITGCGYCDAARLFGWHEM